MITLNGRAFSGGQRQLIARALANRPRILLLDGATSALDNVTQRLINNNLARRGMTRIVIARRLSTMVDADRILVLDGGRVADRGLPRAHVGPRPLPRAGNTETPGGIGMTINAALELDRTPAYPPLRYRGREERADNSLGVGHRRRTDAKLRRSRGG